MCYQSDGRHHPLILDCPTDEHNEFSRFSSPDVNDNVPFFTSSIYEASVTEGAESGTLVFQVSANDLDLGLNGKVTITFNTMLIFMNRNGPVNTDGTPPPPLLDLLLPA